MDIIWDSGSKFGVADLTQWISLDEWREMCLGVVFQLHFNIQIDYGVILYGISVNTENK